MYLSEHYGNVTFYVSGEITMGNVLEVLPFGNEVDLITVRGSTLLKALERSVANYDPVEMDGVFLQFSGKEFDRKAQAVLSVEPNMC